MAFSWRIMQGDVLAVLPTLPERSVHCVVTSPPYWGLRDYGVEGQIGLEETPAAYLERMVAVFRAVWRVLRDDGTCWVNMGDSYAGSGRGGNPNGPTSTLQGGRATQEASMVRRSMTSIRRRDDHPVPRSDVSIEGLKSKDLVGMPWRLAFALHADGWYLRSDIIWAKPNPMPESVTDRPTKAHEYIFLLSKRERYYYDAEAIREPHSEASIQRAAPHRAPAGASERAGETPRPGSGSPNTLRLDQALSPGGRNRRTVWTVPTQAYAEAHFATFPEKLIEPCILAGTSECGCCAACRAPWERVVENASVATGSYHDHADDLAGGTSQDSPRKLNGKAYYEARAANPPRTTGWKPSCKCGAAIVPCTVLDPFNGSGTTGVVSIGHRRNYIGVELNPAYIDMARRRIGAVNPLLSREEVPA